MAMVVRKGLLAAKVTFERRPEREERITYLVKNRETRRSQGLEAGINRQQGV